MSEPTQRINTADFAGVRETHIEEQELVDLALNNLSGDDEQSIRGHLNTCPTCRERLKALHLEDGMGATKVRDPMVGQTLGEYRVEAALARGGAEPERKPSADGQILVCDTVPPAELAQLAETGLRGLICTASSPYSHTAILARGLRLPFACVAPGTDETPRNGESPRGLVARLVEIPMGAVVRIGVGQPELFRRGAHQHDRGPADDLDGGNLGQFADSWIVGHAC